MNQLERDQIGRVEMKLDEAILRMEDRREKDRDSAKADNDRRHMELREDFTRVIIRLDQINGNVRNNTGRIERMEGAREAEKVTTSVLAKMDPRKAAAAGAGGLAGAAAIIYAMVEFAKVLMK